MSAAVKDATPDVTPAWSARLLDLGRRAGEIPLYGSREWDQLDPHDPRKFAAVVRAAEAWRREGTQEAIAARLRAELADNDQLCAWRLRQMSHDLAGALDWNAQARRPSWVELERRRHPWKEAA